MRRYSSNRGFGTAARLVALVALLGFQLAYAGHETQHAAGDLAETCAACAHLDQNAPAAPDAAPCAEALPVRDAGSAPMCAPPLRFERSAHAIRAPPRG
jgi:hypothetical protein